MKFFTQSCPGRREPGFGSFSFCLYMQLSLVHSASWCSPFWVSLVYGSKDLKLLRSIGPQYRIGRINMWFQDPKVSRLLHFTLVFYHPDPTFNVLSSLLVAVFHWSYDTPSLLTQVVNVSKFLDQVKFLNGWNSIRWEPVPRRDKIKWLGSKYFEELRITWSEMLGSKSEANWSQPLLKTLIQQTEKIQCILSLFCSNQHN